MIIRIFASFPAPVGKPRLALLVSAVLVILLAVANVALAASDTSGSLDPSASPHQGLSIGVGIIDLDRGYAGVDNQVIPIPFITYRHDRFFLKGITGGFVLAQNRNISLAIELQPRLGSIDASDSPRLAGIKDREWTIDGGFAMTWRGGWGKLNGRVFHDILDRDSGTSAELGYSYTFSTDIGFLTPGIGVKWQSSRLTAYYYGVSPAESRPGRPSYSPGSATSPYVSLFDAIPVTAHWHLVAGVRYSELPHSVTRSPIVDQTHTLTIMTVAVYAF